jgi:hypothetical protein
VTASPQLIEHVLEKEPEQVAMDLNEDTEDLAAAPRPRRRVHSQPPDSEEAV